MPPKTLPPELIRLLQRLPSFQGLPQAPQQIQSPAPIEQALSQQQQVPIPQQQVPAPTEQLDLAQQLQQQGPAQKSTKELGQKDILTNKLGQQYMALLSDKTPSASDDPYTRSGKLFKKGGIGGILGGLGSLAASPLGAGLIGMMMDPYEGAGLYKGAAAGEALRVQKNKRITAQRQKKIEEIRQYLKLQGGGDIQKAIDKAGGIAQAQQDVARKARIPPRPEEIPEGYQFVGFGSKGKLLFEPILQTQEEKLEQFKKQKIIEYDLKSKYDQVKIDKDLDKSIATEQRKASAATLKNIKSNIAGLNEIEGIGKHLESLLDDMPFFSTRTDPISSIGQRIEGGFNKAGTWIGLSPKTAVYLGEAKSLMGRLSRKLAQETGVQTDKDIGRQKGFIAWPADSLVVRKAKMKNFFEVIDMLKHYAALPLSEKQSTRGDIIRLMRGVGLKFTEIPGWEFPKKTGEIEVPNTSEIKGF